ncbi:hypothetical protein [Clostridium sp. 'White wine YQ']|uniref:hypothetical protein n=1 Tax=Clostridium sp. 'White wine YQ' TaxID=3027474 RepID=UPI002365E2BD|nr:hypothetical protein [Clostridium sp. 'White wine YQ']MDD7793708.1 hypothetical protein [Clostridium sp. 'White wine YQ']
MSAYQSPNNIYINGPLLIDEKKINDLEELEKSILEILNLEYEKLYEITLKNYCDEFKVETIPDDISKTILRIYSSTLRIEHEILAKDKSGNLFKFQSIVALIRSSELSDKRIVGIKMHYRMGENSVTIEISDTSGTNFSANLGIQDDIVRNEVTYYITKFTNQFYKIKLLRFWKEATFFIWPILLFLILGMFSILGSQDSGIKDAIKQKMISTIEKGVTQENINESVQLIMEYESSYPKDIEIQQNGHLKTEIIIILTLMAVSVMLSIHPKTVIGVGKGKDVINRWKIYTNLLFITVPGIILTDIIIPKLI